MKYCLGVLRLASGARNGTLFNLEGTRPWRQDGGLAQLVEHLLCKQGVTGSSPVTSTSEIRLKCLVNRPSISI